MYMYMYVCMCMCMCMCMSITFMIAERLFILIYSTATVIMTCVQVRGHGYFCDFLRDKCRRKQALPPKIYLHAYAGNVDITKQLLRLNIADSNSDLYFGFASSSNLRNQEKLSQVLQLIPSSKLLLESDGEKFSKKTLTRNKDTENESESAPIMPIHDNNNAIEVDLRAMRDFMCRVYGMNEHKLCVLTAKNALDFFGT